VSGFETAFALRKGTRASRKGCCATLTAEGPPQHHYSSTRCNRDKVRDMRATWHDFGVTVVAWHRAGFRLFWTRKVRRGQPGRPVISREVRALIRRRCREIAKRLRAGRVFNCRRRFKVWGLRSSAVKLDGHLGHKVTVSGLITHESKAGGTKKGKTERVSGNEESGDLRVASLKMVSETCGN
jgi:hypothetical protein